MSGYYPEGVTGFEDEIAGPRYEEDETITTVCEYCGWSGDVECLVRYWRDDRDVLWTCPDCKEDHCDAY